MTWFIDRRLNGKNKSMVNRQRFLRRYKAQIKQSISEAINKRSVTDVDSGESVSIPTEDISEPMFHQGRGGLRHRVHPGNDHFVQNDRIERPQGGGGGSGSGQGQASQDGEGQDEFVFQISKDEYLDLLFEDLALPNLKQNQQRQLTEYKTHRAGYTANGVPANISVVRSLQNSLARRTAMTAGKRRELHALEENLAIISNSEPAQLLEEERLRKEIAELRAKIERVPFIDTFDLRYKNYEKRPDPSSQAVMFCLMDVSGSMDQSTKDMAKRFYILLYLFDGLHGAFPVSGVGDAHGLAGFLIHQFYGTQVEFPVDDVEGVGVDEAEVGVYGDVVEVQGPVAVVEGAGNAVEGDEAVEAAA